jgi:hypothetical protein
MEQTLSDFKSGHSPRSEGSLFLYPSAPVLHVRFHRHVAGRRAFFYG